MNKPRGQLLIAFTLVVLFACLGPALSATTPNACTDLDGMIANKGTMTKSFCIYYNTTDLSINTVNDTTNTQKIVRYNIALGTYNLPRYSYFRIYGVAKYPSTLTNPTRDSVFSLALRSKIGDKTPIWPAISSNLNKTAVYYERSDSYPKKNFFVELGYAASTKTATKTQPNSVFLAGVFYHINYCVEYDVTYGECMVCEMGYSLTSDFNSCEGNIPYCAVYSSAYTCEEADEGYIVSTSSTWTFPVIPHCKVGQQ